MATDWPRDVAPDLVLDGAVDGLASLGGLPVPQGGLTTVDDFEAGVSSWSMDGGYGSISQNTSVASEGSASAELSSGGSVPRNSIYARHSSYQNAAPGEVWEFDYRSDSSSTDTAYGGLQYGGGGAETSGYRARVRPDGNAIELYRIDGASSFSLIASGSVTMSFDTFQESRLQWQSDGTHKLTVGGTTISATDTTYGEGPVYLVTRDNGVAQFDHVQKGVL